MFDRFSGVKFWSSERNIENAMLQLHFNEDREKWIHVKMKFFDPP